jgi:hypothetical protein
MGMEAFVMEIEPHSGSFQGRKGETCGTRNLTIATNFGREYTIDNALILGVVPLDGGPEITTPP